MHAAYPTLEPSTSAARRFEISGLFFGPATAARDRSAREQECETVASTAFG
jgi:hypothetical protein